MSKCYSICTVEFQTPGAHIALAKMPNHVLPCNHNSNYVTAVRMIMIHENITPPVGVVVYLCGQSIM